MTDSKEIIMIMFTTNHSLGQSSKFIKQKQEGKDKKFDNILVLKRATTAQTLLALGLLTVNSLLI